MTYNVWETGALPFWIHPGAFEFRACCKKFRPQGGFTSFWTLSLFWGMAFGEDRSSPYSSMSFSSGKGNLPSLIRGMVFEGRHSSQLWFCWIMPFRVTKWTRECFQMAHDAGKLIRISLPWRYHDKLNTNHAAVSNQLHLGIHPHMPHWGPEGQKVTFIHKCRETMLIQTYMIEIPQ